MAERAFDLSGISVMIAMPVNRDVPVQTMISMLKTQDALSAKGIPVEFQFQIGGSLVHHSRTKCVHHFLKSDKARLFWVDSDIEWRPEDFIRLLALSTVMEAVGGLYPAKGEPAVFMIDGMPGREIESNEYGCLSVGGFGMGFSVFQRGVIEKLAAQAPPAKFPNYPEPLPYVFRCDLHNGEARGEDIAFFADVRALGYSVWLDPTIRLGHIGAKVYSGSMLDAVLTKQPKELQE